MKGNYYYQMANNKKYFLFDMETGGSNNRKTTPLSLYGFMLNSKLEILDIIDLKLKPDDGRYHIDISILKTNKIDILKHHEEAVSISYANTKIRDFLSIHSSFGQNKIIPTGYDIKSDIGFLINLLPEFNVYCDEKNYDITSIIQSLILSDFLKEEHSGNLIDLCTVFGISDKFEMFPNKIFSVKENVNMSLEILKIFKKIKLS